MILQHAAQIGSSTANRRILPSIFIITIVVISLVLSLLFPYLFGSFGCFSFSQHHFFGISVDLLFFPSFLVSVHLFNVKCRSECFYFWFFRFLILFIVGLSSVPSIVACFSIVSLCVCYFSVSLFVSFFVCVWGGGDAAWTS